MNQEFVRFMPVLLQLGSPLRVNVYEMNPATGKARLLWTMGHVFQPKDLGEVLNPARRLLVLKTEHDSALLQLAREGDEDEVPFWCG